MTAEETGLEVVDTRVDAAFAARQLHARDVSTQMDGLRRLSHALLERPGSILQELVQAAVELCNADSAGISIERPEMGDDAYYHWVAASGQYSAFTNAVLPRYPSACGVCLERGHAQHFTVTPKFFEILGVEASPVTDGILLPWTSEGTRGTIFVMAHGRTEAFDTNDVRLMNMLADFAAMGIKQQKQQKMLILQERAQAAAHMANNLAHKINNPLQSLTNTAYLMTKDDGRMDIPAMSLQLSSEIERLSELVRQLLALPFDTRGGADAR